MARSERQVPSVYFGRPGSLVTMPWPRGDQDQNYEKQTFDFLTGSGQHAVSSLATGSRPFVLNWNALHIDTFALVEQYWIGANGTGPWAYINPALTNMLLPNQAAASGIFNDTRGWGTETSTAAEGALSSNATATNWIHRPGGTRSLRWAFPVAAATTPRLLLSSPYRSWFGFPVFPALSYAWSFWARPDGVTDTAVTLAPRLRWYGPTGALLLDSTGGTTSVTTWQRLSVIAAAPAGAAYVQPVIEMTGSTMTTLGSVYLDEPLLEQDTVVNAWAAGSGARPVEILNITDRVPFETRMRTTLTMNLREVAQ